MTLGVTGASGFIGRRVIELALRRGYEVVAYTRNPQRLKIPGCEVRGFSADALPDVAGVDAMVHLAGESVVGFWTAGKKRTIVESRVLGTRRVAEAILAAKRAPEVLVSGSAIGFYGDRGEEELMEGASVGKGFLANACVAWEAEAGAVERVCRVVRLRTGIVLGRGGGALRAMRWPFRLGGGAVLGDGRQWVSWIHLDDIARMFLFCVEDLEVRGAVNGTAPWPRRNADYSRAIARSLGAPLFLRVPAAAVRLAGEFSEELLDSKKVLPGMAGARGFRWDYPELESALKVEFGG